MFQDPFAQVEKHDPALDSGVCPSPDECYQSYYDAFPALSPSDTSFVFNNNSADLVQQAGLTETTCHNWQNTKRHMVDILRRTSSSSSPPACLTKSREISKSSHSAPSPTLLDHTPNKRQKLLPSKAGNIAVDVVVTDQPISGIVGDSNRSSSSPFTTWQLSTDKPRSCPTVQQPTGRRKLSSPTAPNFCCPQITQSADGGLAAHLPIFATTESEQTSATHWPHFVVPKCFKVGSWPSSKNDVRHSTTSDVPFWSCGEWFCTVHKGVQFSLLSAKVDDEASKVLSPDPFYEHKAIARQHCWATKQDDDEQFFDAMAGGDVGELPTVGQIFGAKTACHADNWARPPAGDQVEMPSSYDQLKADVFNNTVQLDSHWPTDIDLGGAQHDVPEFDPFPPTFYNNTFPLVQDLTALQGGGFPSVQEIGFCLPKFDLSPTVLLSKGPNVATTTKAYCSYGSNSNTCIQPPEIEILSQQLPSDSFDVGNPYNNNGDCKQRAVAAVPISPQTHFVPIRSESVEDAYLTSEHTTATSTCTCCPERAATKKKGLAYVEDTGYYIFLHPDKNSTSCQNQLKTISSSVTTDCNANKIASGDASCCCCACHALQPPMKASKSLGHFDVSTATRTRRSRSPFSVKFRASKPGKMVQTEDKYFLYCSGGGHVVDKQHYDDPFVCDLDIDDLLAEEAPLDLSSPGQDEHDRSNNNNNGGGDGFFEIWACNALPVPDDPCSLQAKWASPNFAKQCPAGSDNLRPLAANVNVGVVVDNHDALQLAAWRKQDERDEELLLRYVSNISLISPLDLDESYDDDDEGNGVESPT